jgi:molecular chaperone Hsp33
VSASRAAGPLAGGDELIRTLSPDGHASVRVLVATRLARDAVARHRTSPTASVALARALMGGLLLASEGKDAERVQLQVRGDGPLGTILVTAGADGCVRGYVQHPSANPPLVGPNLGLSRAIGGGVLRVERNHPAWRQPYAGIVPLVTGELAQDLAHYLLESEQKPSALALGVYLGPEGEIEAAGGYLIQSLPGAPDAVRAALERRVAGLAHPSALLRAGAGADALLERLIGDTRNAPLARITPRFHCPCGPQRVLRAVALLGRDELREIVQQQQSLEVRCAFCASVHRVAPADLAPLLYDP